MITSRPEVSITYTFPSARILPIRAADDDINKYVTSRITSVPRFLPVLRTSPGLEDLIRRTVVEKAGGMYVDLSMKFVFIYVVMPGRENIPEILSPHPFQCPCTVLIQLTTFH